VYVPFSKFFWKAFFPYKLLGSDTLGFVLLKNEDWGYTCFYGPNPTFFTAEGKQNFNQPGYEDYKFKNNTWYHIAGTFEPADNGMNIFRFYVNGELALELPTKGSTQGWQKAIIGNGGFNGWVRDFRIWERALSQGEIKETMWSIDPASEGLVMYLPLEKDFKNAIPGHEEDWIHQSDKSSTNYHFNETCQDTVPQAIIAFLESTDFEDAIRNAISIGGDSDTLAAITGSIAEAAYGIPDWIKDKAYTYLDEPLKDVLRRWEKEVSIS